MSGIDFDVVLEKIGTNGLYQKRLFYLLSIPATLPGVFLYFIQVFASASPDHWCRVPVLEEALGIEAARDLAVPYKLGPDGSKQFSFCEIYDVNFTQLLSNITKIGFRASDMAWNKTQCTSGWHYDRTHFDETLVTQLDLVCDKSWWPATSTTCFCVGSLMGNILFGMVGDRWGRRPALLAAILWHVIFSILTVVLTTNYVIYTVLRTVNALVFPAIYQVPFVQAIEMMGPKHRSFAGMMLCVFFALALVFLALLTFIFRNWFSLYLYTSVPCVLLFTLYWILPESPRWLLSQGRLKEAEVIVQQMAKTNGKVIPSDFLYSFQGKQETLNADTSEKEEEEEEEKVTVIDALKRPLLRRCIILIAFIWVTNAMVYGGLAFNSGNLGVSDQIGFLIGAVVELPSYLISWWAMDKYGRRKIVWICMFFGGLSCLLSALVREDYVWTIVTFAMIGRFGIAASFAVFYVYVGEVLPTVVRSQSMATGGFVADIGWLAFPFVVHLATFWRVLPLLVFGVLSTAGGLASMLLPETLGRPLPQTLSDGENLHKTGLKSSASYFKERGFSINNER